MTDSDAISEAAGGGTFKDRKVGLIAFGVVQLLMALALLGIAALQVVMFFGAETLAPGTATSPALFAFSSIFYLLLGAGAVWLGIGSIQCRRWARALTLVLAWMGLVAGLLGTVFMVSLFRPLSAELSGELGGANPAAAIAMGCMFVGVAFFYIILPVAFVLFYRSPNVKATCEHYDPTPRWTDRYPLPLLGGGLLLLSMAGVVIAPGLGTPMPFFGALLTGAPAWIIAFAIGIAALVLSWGFFRRQRWAWLGAMALFAVYGLSTVLSFRGDGIARMYEAMNLPPEQLEAVEGMSLAPMLPVMVGVSVLAMLAFYLWLGRYFGRTGTGDLPAET